MIALLAFLSGAAGLIFEVLWARRLATVLGGTALAQMTVLASFLGGLAAGSAWFGRRVDRAASPTAFYSRLEWAVAAAGLLAPVFLLIDAPWVGAPAVALLVGHAFLMGGALPALCRCAGGEAQAEVGRAYAANCAGAVIGGLAASFLLIPALGLGWAFAAAAALNAAAALGARRLTPLPAPRTAARPVAAIDPGLAVAAVFVSGFVALTFEIAWTRLLSLVFGSSVYSFAEMLAGFIAGSSLGAFLASKPWARRQDPRLLLGSVLAAAGAATLATLPLYGSLPYAFVAVLLRTRRTPSEFMELETIKFALCFGLMAAPALFLGAALPVATRLASRGQDDRGSDAGGVFSWNAAGNMLGAFAGWLMLPWLGIEGVLRSGVTVLFLAGAALLAPAWSAAKGARRAAWALFATAMVVVRVALPRWDRLPLAMGAFREPLTVEASLVYERDDREATVSVVRYEGAPPLLTLKVNGKTDASNGWDMATQVLLGELPMLLKPDAKRVMLVGWGSGVTAGSLLRHPLERLDAAELIPAVVTASNFFIAENGGARLDPRLRLAAEDGKRALARPGPAYDLIVSEPSNPWMAGVGDLFTAEFYRRARARLTPDGLMVQWFHTYEMDDALFALTLRSFRSSFPFVTIWNLTGADLILIGSPRPLKPDFFALEGAFLRPGVREDLLRLGIRAPSTILALQSHGPDAAAALAGTGPLNTELRPRLEYGAPRAFFLGSLVQSVAETDERGTPEGRSHLLLAAYRKSRVKPLSREEYRDFSVFPRGSTASPGLADWMAEWRRLYPDDRRAR